MDTSLEMKTSGGASSLVHFVLLVLLLLDINWNLDDLFSRNGRTNWKD